ncbi:MAG TPA: hypothetical protein VGK31_09995 [Thermoanaerobaculia bacterium]
MFTRRIALVFGAVLLFGASAAFAAMAKGTLTVNGKTFNLKNAYATNRKNPFDKKKTDVVVILTDKELKPGAQFDEFALMSLPDEGISGISFEVDADKRINSGTLFSPSFKKMKQFSSTGNQKLDLTASTKDRIAGTISIKPDTFFEESFQYSATFDAPILAKPPEKPVVLKGTPLPADGGEPAKAWQAHRKAIASGDIAAIRKTIAAEHVKDLDDPDFKKMLPLMKEMQPKKVKITGGSIDGDTATLLVKNLDEKNSTGTVTMRREGGQWKLAKEAWKTTSE